MKTISLTVLCLALGSLCLAQNSFSSIDSLIKATSAQHPHIGISVGVIQNGQQQLFNYGFTDRSGKTRVSETTTFEIGSITKLLTGYLIAQQVDAGTIQLDNVIDAYLPDDFTLNSGIQNQIKVSDLASHQSGLPEFDMLSLIQSYPTQPFDGVSKATVDSMLSNAPNVETAGTYRYSNLSYALLGAILENTLNARYEDLLKQQVFQPLNMHNTYTSDVSKGTAATGYNAQNEERPFLNWNPIAAPAGLVKSNTADMLRFVQALLNSENESVNQILRTTYFKNTFIELGLGLNIIRDGNAVIYAKSGDSLGQSSVLAFNPAKNWGVIILTNQANGTARQLFGDISVILN